MEPHLRAGIAIYNAGQFHAAHDAWEAHWLDLDTGTDDEQFLHGLIQFTAAVYHASNGNWSGATGLADSAGEYLDGLPPTYRGVNVGDVRSELGALARDPEVVERRHPLALTHDGHELELDDLRFEATAVAADVVAEEHGYDEQLVETATRYAREDLSDDVASSPFVTLLFDFVREPENRGIVVQRLGEHADRRQSRDDDVSGLFDER
jgi:hypothetical protein